MFGSKQCSLVTTITCQVTKQMFWRHVHFASRSHKDQADDSMSHCDTTSLSALSAGHILPEHVFLSGERDAETAAVAIGRDRPGKPQPALSI